MEHEVEWSEPDADLDELAHRVIGAAIEVHRLLGPGFLESVYEEALAIELELRRIPFERQKLIAVAFKGHPVGEGRLDFLIGGRLVIELKAVEAILPIHQAQAISYLRTTDLSLALIINFNVPILSKGVKRVVLSRSRAASREEDSS